MFSDSVRFSVLLCDVRWYCVMCSDTVRFAVLLCDVQWYDVMCSDTVRCAVILCDVKWYCAVCNDTVRCAVILCDVKWYLRCAVIMWNVQWCDVQWYCAMYSYTRHTAVYFFCCLQLGGFFLAVVNCFEFHRGRAIFKKSVFYSAHFYPGFLSCNFSHHIYWSCSSHQYSTLL